MIHPEIDMIPVPNPGAHVYEKIEDRKHFRSEIFLIGSESAVD